MLWFYINDHVFENPRKDLLNWTSEQILKYSIFFVSRKETSDGRIREAIHDSCNFTNWMYTSKINNMIHTYLYVHNRQYKEQKMQSNASNDTVELNRKASYLLVQSRHNKREKSIERAYEQIKSFSMNMYRVLRCLAYFLSHPPVSLTILSHIMVVIFLCEIVLSRLVAITNKSQVCRINYPQSGRCTK